jgi:hypothetical protein
MMVVGLPRFARDKGKVLGGACRQDRCWQAKF